MNQPWQVLLSQVQQLLGATLPPAMRSKQHESDLFECYIFGLALKAARAEGATITYEDVNGRRPQQLVFRTSPGYIYSTERSYCHAVIQFPNHPLLEAHVGIRVTGASGVMHECDVAVLERAEARMCRTDRVQPRQARVIIAAECKYYAQSMSLVMARAFVGLSSDLSGRGRFFVFNTDSDSVERYLTARSRTWEHRVEPSSPTAERLRYTLQTAFRDYLATH